MAVMGLANGKGRSSKVEELLEMFPGGETSICGLDTCNTLVPHDDNKCGSRNVVPPCIPF